MANCVSVMTRMLHFYKFTIFMLPLSMGDYVTRIRVGEKARRCHTFVILFPIADPSGRDNPLEIYHIGYIFRTGR